MSGRSGLPALLRQALPVPGMLLLAGAAAWWWIVFERVVSNGYMAWGQAVPCLARGSATCSLAMALCTANAPHWLGINRYDTALFWAGLAVTGAGLAAVAWTWRNQGPPASGRAA